MAKKQIISEVETEKIEDKPKAKKLKNKLANNLTIVLEKNSR